MPEKTLPEAAGSSLTDYLVAAGIVVLGIIAAQIVSIAIARVWRKQGDMSAMQTQIVAVVRGIVLPAIYVGSLYGGISFLDLPQKTQRIVDLAALVIPLWFMVRFGTQALRVAIGHWFERRGHEMTNQRLRPLLAVADIALWIAAVVFVLDNLGFKISSIVAGLGIGGITVALASQAVLGDLFGYFVILFDRPFEIGDFIIAGDVSGTIEAIGVKTTKVRSLDGQLIIIANSQLTSSKVHNYKRMERRRVLFTIGVTYGTDRAKLAAIPGLIRAAIDAQADTTFDRAHFKSIGQSSLAFEVVYFVESPDYVLYMDIQQAINLDLVESFAREGIDLAFPTMTVELDGQAR